MWIGPYVVIGTHAEERGPIRGEGDVVVGDRTIIREFTALQGPCRVGADCYLMEKTHIAHDCKVGDFVTISPGAVISGTVTVGNHATLGINASVHQRLTIGEGAMIGMGSVVTKDVPPWELWFGNPARPHGLNTVGLSRLGFTTPPTQPALGLHGT